MRTSELHNGFTLVELMVACAIIAVLVAVALPQLLTFRMKAIRTEAILTLNGAHKSQAAYYVDANHFLTAGCNPGPGPLTVCSLSNPQMNTINQTLGLTTVTIAGNPATPNAYWYQWYLSDSAKGYELELFTYGSQDVIDIGVQGYLNLFFNCQPCGDQDGIPFQFRDAITHKTNCPCP